MKKLVTAVAVAGLIGTPAFAADMYVKAPPPAPVSSWTGWYVGANAGGLWENNPGVQSNFAQTACVGIIPSACADVSAVGNSSLSALNTKGSGFIGGGQLGYNWQWTPNWVVGIETDFQGVGVSGSGSGSGTANNAAGVPYIGQGFVTEKTDWFGTLRGRLGWTLMPSLLVYGTGGLAYGHVETSASFSGSFPTNPTPVSGSTSLSQSSDRTGYTVGGGFEWMFAPRWSAKAEYLYYDLGTVTLNQTLTVALASGGGFIGTAVQSTTRYNGNIARAGINYHF
jgi:outer membrane immunogenic protein